MLHDWLLISTTTLLFSAIFCMGLVWVMRGNSRPKLWLAAIMTVISVWIVSVTVMCYLLPDFLPEKLMFSYSLIGIVIAGLTLIYFRTLILPWKNNLRIIRVFFSIISVSVFLYIAISISCATLPKLYTLDDVFENITHPVVLLRIVTFLTFVVVLPFVYTQIFLMYLRHRVNISKQFSFNENISLSWLPYLIIFFILFGTSGVFDMLTIDVNWIFVAINFIFAGFYLTMTFLGLRQQDIYTKTEIDQNKSEIATTTNKLSVEMQNRLTGELIELMQKKRAYRNPELRLDGIAKALNTNRTYLSTIIRENFEDNFMGLVNRYRIEEAKKILSDNNTLSMTEISEQVGFKSISSFNLFFKKEAWVSPSLFRRSVCEAEAI